MKRLFVLLGIAVGALWLSGCDSDPKTDLRVLHASPDAPAVNVLVGDNTVLEDVDYKTGSGYLRVRTGTRSIAVEGLLPGDVTQTVIGPVDVDLEKDTRYTVVAFGEVAAIEPLVVTVPAETVGAGEVRVQVLHAAPAAPEVDVYVVEPDTADPTGLPALGSFGPKETLGPATVPAGDYRILVTLQGTTNVVFDSGPIALPGGADLLVSAVNNTAAGDAPISLVVMDGSGSSEILDVNSPANIRVVHASPDAPPVDVVVDDDFGNPLVPNLAFPEVTGYVAPPAGDYNVKVGPTGNVAGATVIDADVTLDAGERYTVIALGQLAEIEPLILVDDQRRVATEAKVRIVHASTLAGEVDIYVTAPNASLADSTPAFTDVPFKADTGYVSLAAGDYWVTVTPAGSKTAAIGPVPLTLSAGGIYGAIARDSAGPNLPLDLITLDDLAP